MEAELPRDLIKESELQQAEAFGKGWAAGGVSFQASQSPGADGQVTACREMPGQAWDTHGDSDLVVSKQVASAGLGLLSFSGASCWEEQSETEQRRARAVLCWAPAGLGLAITTVSATTCREQ